MIVRLITIMFLATFGIIPVCGQISSSLKAVGDSIQARVMNTIPENILVGKIKVDKIKVNDKRREISVNFNETMGYLPFNDAEISRIKGVVSGCFPEKYDNYKVKLSVKGVGIEKLALWADKKVVGPTETNRFIQAKNGVVAPAGLDGRNIAMWQSHGWYFEPKLNRWEWQRARIFQTVEDLYTQSYVMPFLMPMLENAGAYVISPRERDVNTNEIIVDRDGGYAYAGYEETAGAEKWTDAGIKGFAYTKQILENGDNPFEMGAVRMAKTVVDERDASIASWTADVSVAGKYAVYVSYASLPNSATDALYRINSRQGVNEFVVNQQMGGGTWIYLGHFPLDKGEQGKPIVELVNVSSQSGAVVTADAVKIGGGMGNVARKVKNGNEDIDYQYVVSGYPRFTEGAKYFMQWAGVPDSVYTPSDNENDYTDDYKCRGEWVNYLAGGSSILPERKGLKIPIDLSFAFHTDAGTKLNDTIIGTLGIYHAKGDFYANGTSRYASRDFTDLVMTNIVRDIRAGYEPNWTRRGMWDKSYYEARVPEVPSMLLELLSHQNFADMKYGLDPTFRFAVSRAIYKGMLQFIAKRDNREYVVQPLPVRAFAIEKNVESAYKLSWKETIDELEATAHPKYYIVQERVDDGEFVEVARVEKAEYHVSISDNKIHSYRIVAGNDGGISFPSEVLALCDMGNDKEPVMVVNGFTRVSAPDAFDSGEIAGFNDMRDHGVPYGDDISFIGSQFEFRRDIPWMDDDAAGFGASRANYETKVIAGNTFDYVALHGKAIVAAGRGFVSSSVEAFMESTAQYKMVDLILGKQKEIIVGRGAFAPKYKTFPKKLQDRIAYQCGQGGSIFVSGSYIATDLWDNERATEEDRQFASEILGYKWRVGQASVTGEAYQVQSRFKEFGAGRYSFYSELNGDCYAVESPDSFYPSDDSKGATIMRYGENNLIAGTAFEAENYRTVAIGFPFETIVDEQQRINLMKEIISFFEKPNNPKTKTNKKVK